MVASNESASLELNAKEGHDYIVRAWDGSMDGSSVASLETNAVSGGVVLQDDSLTPGTSRRFYQVVERQGGVTLTNPIVWGVVQQTMNTGAWYRIGLPFDHGDNHGLDGQRGEMLRRGLGGHADRGDLLYHLHTNGTWMTAQLDDSGQWSTNGTETGEAMAPWQGVWIKRRSAGVNTNVVRYGRYPTTPYTIPIRANDWHLLVWPYATSPREDADPIGWGLPAAGAVSSASWLKADQLVLGEGNNQIMLYLRPDNRWYRIGENKPASNVVLRAGESFYYYHRGSGFNWEISP